MCFSYKDTGQRVEALDGVQKVVVKVGTRLLTDIRGFSEAERIDSLVGALEGVRDRGVEVVLVSSGAIGAGMTVLETGKRPQALSHLQAHAAVGQSRLMYHYETACALRGFHSAQLLLTVEDVQDRKRYLNVCSCLDALLARGVLPVINENDSVSVDEIRLGDNDNLAASVATMIRADMTILLTTVDGMHEVDESGEFTRRLSVVSSLNEELLLMAGGTADSRLSTGGMATKVSAAAVVTRAGESLWIADGHDFGVLEKIFSAKDVGTFFPACSEERMRGHKRFLAFFSETAGSIVVDDGAALAIRSRGGSLLARGIVDVRGTFERGDTVRVVDQRDDEVGRGMSNYSSGELSRIKGEQSSRISSLLGYDVCDDEVVHRDYLVLTSGGYQ